MGHLFPPLTLRLRSPEAYGNALRNISKVKKKGAERERGRRQLNYCFLRPKVSSSALPFPFPPYDVRPQVTAVKKGGEGKRESLRG